MSSIDAHGNEFTAEQSWRTIHATVDDARNSMYVAGSATILLLWAAITAVGYLAQYTIDTLATGFAEQYPWFPGPLWGGLGTVGMVASSFIGHRAGQKLAAGDAARNAGIRVFLFWLTVVAAGFLIPAAAGLWNADNAEAIPRVAVAVVALGYVLFGIMYRPVIAVGGIAYAAAFYIPFYLTGDFAPVVSGIAMLTMAAVALIWIRKTGQW